MKKDNLPYVFSVVLHFCGVFGRLKLTPPTTTTFDYKKIIKRNVLVGGISFKRLETAQNAEHNTKNIR